MEKPERLPGEMSEAWMLKSNAGCCENCTSHCKWKSSYWELRCACESCVNPHTVCGGECVKVQHRRKNRWRKKINISGRTKITDRNTKENWKRKENFRKKSNQTGKKTGGSIRNALPNVFIFHLEQLCKVKKKKGVKKKEVPCIFTKM